MRGARAGLVRADLAEPPARVVGRASLAARRLELREERVDGAVERRHGEPPLLQRHLVAPVRSWRCPLSFDCLLPIVIDVSPPCAMLDRPSRATMNRSPMSSRGELKAIARRDDDSARPAAGFLPAVVAETDADHEAPPPRRTPPSATCAACSGARSTTMISEILDQLSVAEPTAGDGEDPRRRRRRRRGREEGLRDRRPRSDQHDVRLHRGRDLPDAAREALDGPDIPRRGPGRVWRS